MSNLRTICRPQGVFSSLAVTFRWEAKAKVSSFGNPNFRPRISSPSVFTPAADEGGWRDGQQWFRMNQMKTVVRASKWSEEKTPYETLELEKEAGDDQIKVAYRRLAKYYHPDVYDGRGTLEEGETAETRFIRIQAAYELLIDGEKRRQYDIDNRENPMKASQAWMEWLLKKRKAFDQRGDMAVSAWAEQQQQLQMNLHVRQLSRTKLDAEEERRILAREKKATQEYLSSTLKRHTLVLKKRDLNRKKAEEQKKNIITQLLAAEGLELDTDADESD